jgi:DNA-binding transcriptional MerR regulator
MQKIDEYFNIKDAVAFLGVLAAALRNWERQGKLETYRNPHNRYRLYCRDDLESFLNRIDASTVSFSGET